jgi:hypothetical protein
MRGFLLSKQIAQASSLFVGFVLDGAAQLLSQLYQFSQAGNGWGPSGPLAPVPVGAVNAFQERPKAGLEHFIIMRTAEPAFGAKFHILDAAGRARQTGQFLRDRVHVLAQDRLKDQGQIEFLVLE